jgi:hypothetical protein
LHFAEGSLQQWRALQENPFGGLPFTSQLRNPLPEPADL